MIREIKGKIAKENKVVSRCAEKSTDKGKLFSCSEHVSWLDTLNMTEEKEDYLTGQPHISLI